MTEGFPHLQKQPYSFWGPPRLPFNAEQGVFPQGIKSLGMKLSTDSI